VVLFRIKCINIIDSLGSGTNTSFDIVYTLAAWTARRAFRALDASARKTGHATAIAVTFAALPLAAVLTAMVFIGCSDCA
jgi:hypothetical protein